MFEKRSTKVRAALLGQGPTSKSCVGRVDFTSSSDNCFATLRKLSLMSSLRHSALTLAFLLASSLLVQVVTGVAFGSYIHHPQLLRKPRLNPVTNHYISPMHPQPQTEISLPEIGLNRKTLDDMIDQCQRGCPKHLVSFLLFYLFIYYCRALVFI